MAFTPNFVFADAVPAQQAVQYAQIAAGQQAAQDQAFNERMRNATQGRIAQQNAQQQMALSQSQMQNSNAQRELDRQLQDRGYLSQQEATRIAAGPRDEAIKAKNAADALAQKQFAMDNFNRGTSYALTLNDPKTPLSLKQKLMQSGDVEMGPDGIWRSRHPNPNPTESIDDIRMKVQGIPGSMGVGGKIPAAMDTVPSRSRMLNLAPPPAPVTYPVAPPGPSPFETPGFQIFRQSDFVNPPEAPLEQPWMYGPQPVQ